MDCLFDLGPGTFLGVFKNPVTNTDPDERTQDGNGKDMIVVFTASPFGRTYTYPDRVRIFRVEHDGTVPFRVLDTYNPLTESGRQEVEKRVALIALQDALEGPDSLPDFRKVFEVGTAHTTKDGHNFLEVKPIPGAYDFSPTLERTANWHLGMSKVLSYRAQEMQLACSPLVHKKVNPDTGEGRPTGVPGHQQKPRGHHK